MRSLLLLSFLLLTTPIPAASPPELAIRYQKAIEAVNAKHAAKPGKNREGQIAAKLPRKATRDLEALLSQEDDAKGLAEALVTAAEASLELARTEDFARLCDRLSSLDTDRAAAVGVARTTPRVLYRGIGGLDEEYLARFATVFEAVLDGYQAVFGFEEWSKVPGKKLRVRVHLEDEISRPPHFAPQFPYHSEIDFPVIDAERFRSPTSKGQFLFYGLCHELGHVIAMWGHRQLEEDRHAWAHYTGVVLVEYLSEEKKGEPWLAELRDQRWRSLEKLREEVDGVSPSLTDRQGVLALLVGLHDAVGPKTIGAALNQLDRAGAHQRVNRVRYYRMKALRDALVAGVKDKRKKRQVAALFSAAGL